MIGTQPQNSTRQQFIRYWLPVIAYAGFILFVSSLPIRIRHAPFPHYDKVFHFIEYGIFAGLWYRALRMTTPIPSYGWGWTGVATFLICLMFGTGDELYQVFTPYRVSDIYDVVADASGAFAVVFPAMIKGLITPT
ncbi:MAG: VanZ family protein [Nitrospirae bacterium]|nr:VanZ family protein [Nitrospirota bacterium]